MTPQTEPLSSSFRDPSGFVFSKEGIIYRTVNLSYKEDYDFFLSSGLKEKLTEKKLTIPFKEIEFNQEQNPNQYKLLLPEQLQFISYSYEWSFSQLKDAALVTLDILKTALEYSMILKDASAFNIQFHKGKAVLIDTLSFEKYEQGIPWVAYRQFCQHFLAPLALMKYNDSRCNHFLKNYIDGLPLDLTCALLPFKSKLNLSLLIHLHLHAKSINKHSNTNKSPNKNSRFSLTAFKGLISSLESAINSLKADSQKSEWSNYYQETILNETYLLDKKVRVKKFAEQSNCNYFWDLGSNTGEFSRLVAEKKNYVVSLEYDVNALEKNYVQGKENKEENILPLYLDLTNPTPSIGWNNAERPGLFKRKHPECILALALTHHLIISNNIPEKKLAEFFSEHCKWLIVEFIPKDDLKVQQLLAFRKDIFDNYSQNYFESQFEKLFIIKERQTLDRSNRILYLMKNKNV